MSYVNPGIVLYLRPTAAIQPYRIKECAIWLVETQRIKDYRSARMWLSFLEINHREQFRYIMSRYFEENMPIRKTKKYNIDDFHHNNKPESYGEPHMK